MPRISKAAAAELAKKEKQREYNRRYWAKKKAERAAAAPDAELEAHRAKVQAKHERFRHKGKPATRKVNGHNGHALAEWAPGKGVISVPEILASSRNPSSSSRDAALVDRALGLIEAGVALIGMELKSRR